MIGRRLPLFAALAAVLAVVGGCGGSGSGGSASHRSVTQRTTPTTPSTTTSSTPRTAPSTGSPGALQAEANAAAAGDIPDNQVFLTFGNSAAGYSIKYPEGWAQQGSAKHVTFRDKNNIVRIVIGKGPAPAATTIASDVRALKGASIQSPAKRTRLAGNPAFKMTYSTESAPNPVTGKRVKLLVDRYYLWKGGRTAVVDLGTPVGVDNVDAYRLMIQSFRWT